MRLPALLIGFLFLLLGFVQAISAPSWAEGAKAGVDFGAFLQPEVLIKSLGEAASAHSSQLLIHFEALKAKFHKLDNLLQDTNIRTHIVDAFNLQASKFQAEFSAPIPDEAADRHALLIQSIDQTMDVLDNVFDDVGKALKTDLAPIRQAFREARQPVKDVALLITKMSYDYPCLFDLLMFVLVADVIPGLSLFRPILQAIGFSSKGPMKGSLAAGIQSKAYAGRIPKGSVFSKLQKVGMSPPTSERSIFAKFTAAKAFADALASCYSQWKSS